MFTTGVFGTDMRRRCLEFAAEAELDVAAIARTVVDHIRDMSTAKLSELLAAADLSVQPSTLGADITAVRLR